MNITQRVAQQRDYYSTGQTKSYEARFNALASLRTSIENHLPEINQALKEDLGKGSFESYMCEIGMVLDELSFAQKHLKRWMKNVNVKTPLAQFYSKSFTCPEPFGNVLIMSPWNYPFMLTIDPLIGAIAAGNCVTVKPSAYAAATSKIICKIIEAAFNPLHVCVIEGGRAENQALLEERFDFIFFTGSVSVGKLVMEKASANLTPVILELGGKSPCIIDKTANLKIAAKRLAFGKYLNAGQTCVAPDYLLIHRDVKDEFLQLLKLAIVEFFTDSPLTQNDYGHIINEHHYNRLMNLLKHSGNIFYGGNGNEKRQIEPTVLTDVSLDCPVMQEEIFGPILPVICFDEIKEAINIINSRPKPLALYLFSTDKRIQKLILHSTSFGGGCINDTIIHLATPHMGFGGVGESGMGSYHGKLSFNAFTHYKSIVKKASFIDMPIRYRPYSVKKEKLLRLFMK